MSQHDSAPTTELSQEELDANSKADTVAMFSLVIIIVAIATFFASY